MVYLGKSLIKATKSIRFARKGCTNRPFFHIVVAETRFDQSDPIIEQVGTYDGLPNEFNEKLVSLNYERIRFWIGNGAIISKPVEQLLGLAGFYPIHPTTYMTAWRNRRAKAEQMAKNQQQKDQSQEQIKETENANANK